MQQLKDQCVLILGLGVSGLAMAQWCTRLGARVVVADTRAQPPALLALQQHCPQARFLNEPLSAKTLQQSTDVTQTSTVKAVFKSPGLSLKNADPVRTAAQQSGIYCGGELSLFIAALASLRATQGYCPQILAITGTNGKTTTTALCTHLLQTIGVDATAAGNIGSSLLHTLMQRIVAANLPAAWVLELSSFQLESLHSSDIFTPSAATVLNASEDHLDWHTDMQHYLVTKTKIFGTHSTRVINRDDQALGTALITPTPIPTPVAAKSSKQRTKKSQHQLDPGPIVRSFGSDVPVCAGDFGLLYEGGISWLAYTPDTAEAPVHPQALMPVQALRIHGTHNALNALAALALCSSLGYDLSGLLHGLRSYGGEPHRTQSIAILDGVEFFDDSKATNVGATLAALEGLGATRKLIPILGGVGKGQDFTPLALAIAQYARAVVLIGDDAQNIANALQDTNIPLLQADNMVQAVQQAAALAQTGDAVLLSPACASFDMFQDYAQRAQAFAQAVQALGQVLSVPSGGAA